MGEVVVLNPHPRTPTLHDLLAELEEARQLAFHPKVMSPAAAVHATVAKGKLLGMFVTKLQVEKLQPLEHMSVDQVIIQVQNELGDIAAKQLRSYVRQLERQRDERENDG